MRVLVISGAGLSAESGLPTFRGPGGLYESVATDTRADAPMTPEAFLSAPNYRRDRAGVERWHDALRAQVQGVQPNAAHHALAAYQARHPDTLLATQNVDGLLTRAGAREILELHGSLFRARCLGRSHPWPLDDPLDLEARCPTCQSRLRTDVVLFEERAPAYQALYGALRRATPDDVLLVIGTTGRVLPITEMVRRFPGRSVLQLLGPSDAIDASRFTLVRYAPVAATIGEVLGTLDTWRHEARSGRSQAAAPSGAGVHAGTVAA